MVVAGGDRQPLAAIDFRRHRQLGPLDLVKQRLGDLGIRKIAEFRRRGDGGPDVPPVNPAAAGGDGPRHRRGGGAQHVERVDLIAHGAHHVAQKPLAIAGAGKGGIALAGLGDVAAHTTGAQPLPVIAEERHA